MDKEQARQAIRSGVSCKDFLEPSKGNMFCCPICGSGTGSHGTGALKVYDGNTWTCHSCGKHGDVIDLYQTKTGTDYNTAFSLLADLLGITIDRPENRTGSRRNGFSDRGNTTTPPRPNASQEAAEVDYRPFFLSANKDIQRTTYHRGISLETLDRFQVGFVENWRHPKAPNAPPTPRLIIPTSNTSYLARDTRDEIPEAQQPYAKGKVGRVHMFNATILTTATQPVFVTEGELDALSIIDVGGEAMALGSVSQVKSLLKLLAEQKPAQPLIIALDSDEAGKKASAELSEGLNRLGIPFLQATDITGGHKDANAALMADREAFQQAVTAAASIRPINDRLEAYLSAYCVEKHLQGFMNGIIDSVNTEAIPTGFKQLDEVLDGGLYEGLYVIGAITSIGKTSFVLQVADQIAQAGWHDVLIFSLEMARAELMAKSISRHTKQRAAKNQNAKTARGITDGKRYEHYSQEETDLIQQAIEDYSTYASRLFIVEGTGNIGTEQIREQITKHILLTGRRPICIVDYLQIVAPCNVRATDKQNMDKCVLELKRLSRDKKIPVIAISSLNRMSYKEAVSLSAFKESGAVEYSADVLIGLQLEGVGTDGFNADKAKSQEIRKVELVVLKHRQGKTGKILFNYHPMFNRFMEAEVKETIKKWPQH